jgi:hypothetical protein
MNSKKVFRLTDRQEMLLYMARLEGLISSQHDDLELFIEFARRVTRGTATEEQASEVRDRLLELGKLHAPKYSDATRQAILQAVSQAPQGHKQRMARQFGLSQLQLAQWRAKDKKHHTSRALEHLLENYPQDITDAEREQLKDVASRVANQKAFGFHAPISTDRKVALGIPNAYKPSVSEDEPILGKALPRFELEDE